MARFRFLREFPMSAKRKTEPSDHGRRSFGRRVPGLEFRRYVLIVCEGRKTERNYFDGLKRDQRLSATVVICGRGENPSSLVEFAVEERARRGHDFERVWCVFDHDEHQDLAAAFNLARDNGICVAFSNPNFELWHLLHFQEQNASITSAKTVNRLQKYIPNYAKSMDDIYHRILERQAKAITRADGLRRRHRRNGVTDPADQNPSTNVDELVVYLNSLAPA
jgi:hypothetical protein